jgi:hypothetical protein
MEILAVRADDVVTQLGENIPRTVSGGWWFSWGLVGIWGGLVGIWGGFPAVNGCGGRVGLGRGTGVD